MLPVLRAVSDLGGSASAREITDRVIEGEQFTEDQLAIGYGTRQKSVLVDRIDWARSYCKLGGALESPARKLYLITVVGHEIVALPDDEARARLVALDRLVRTARVKRKKAVAPAEADDSLSAQAPLDDIEIDIDDDDSSTWNEIMLGRLHGLTPAGFEEFVMYTLRLFGLELTRRGGSGDEGIDGIGTAPLSDVLSATVAVQVKRYDPTSTVGRETVALFQRDASAVGAERAILVTLGRFSAPARKAASSATPHVDLIDGTRLCELILAKEIGVKLTPVVDVGWFDRFD